ncbi:distal tail protein Dit [Allofustis seminis]|uniref:distal tail protein Dit n=1 Tax=Allofustis seminis TaxID=166939 RepID=UPI000365A9E3|nr:distal tail protein Dit [Allofustis seminis]
MYQFVDTNEEKNGILAPSDNMNINGVGLNQYIEGYQQLSVMGRELIGYNVNATEIPLRNGAFFNYRQLPVRELEVTYELKSNSPLEVREKFAQLNQALKPELDLTFDDEPDWHYYGMLTDASTPKINGLVAVGSFVITCFQPFAFKKEQQSKGNISLEYADRVLPQKITLHANTTETIEVSNGRETLKLRGSYSSGDLVEIIYEEQQVIIQKNRKNIASDLELQSYPETFYLRDGDLITVKNGTLVLVVWRDEKL